MSNVVKFDPDTTDTRANAHGKVGWKGSFPSTPCPHCEGELFVWIGDWSLGYYCYSCRRVWREDDAHE